MQIKVKGWDTEKNEWYTGISELLWIDTPIFDLDQIYGLELCMSTGIIDKNGKEIYEGDYVRYLSGNKGYFFEGTIKRLNHFGYNGVFVKINTNKPYEYFMIDMMKINSEEHIYNLPEEIEIVGNIYENPKLLD